MFLESFILFTRKKSDGEFFFVFFEDNIGFMVDELMQGWRNKRNNGSCLDNIITQES